MGDPVAAGNVMILWTPRGYSDPHGQFEGGEIVCARPGQRGRRQPATGAQRRDPAHESHGKIESARGKAEILRETFLKQGGERRIDPSPSSSRLKALGQRRCGT